MADHSNETLIDFINRTIVKQKPIKLIEYEIDIGFFEPSYVVSQAPHHRLSILIKD